MMMAILFIALYAVQLMIVYYVLRKIYINEPYLIGFLDLICFVPVVGFLLLISVHLQYLPNNKMKKRFLDKLFMVNK